MKTRIRPPVIRYEEKVGTNFQLPNCPLFVFVSGVKVLGSCGLNDFLRLYWWVLQLMIQMARLAIRKLPLTP